MNRGKIVRQGTQTFFERNGSVEHMPAYTYGPGRTEAKYALQAVEHGIRVVFMNVGAAWTTDGAFDTANLDKGLNTFADAPEDLGLIVRFTITTPTDFAEKYPEELVRFAHIPDGQMDYPDYKGGLMKTLPRFASFASEVWREAGCRYIDAVIDFVEKHPRGKRVIGYMINTGCTAEAILWGFQEGMVGDFSRPGKRAFRDWLRKNYATDAALQAAWNEDQATLDSAEPPGIAERERASFGELRDPARDRRAIDYDRFLSDLVVDDLLLWHRHARKRLGADTLQGCFYGYCLWESGMLNRTPGKGHCALGRLLEAQEIDFVTGITTYWKRALGDPGNTMLPTPSVALHGKMHWNEDDLRTHVVLSNDNTWCTPASGVPLNEEGSVNLYRRQFVRALADNSQSWYFDIVGGMYDSPGILAEFDRQRVIANRLADADMASCAEVACIVSEQTPLYHPTLHGNLHQRRAAAADLLCDRVTEGLYRAGVPLDWYLSSDLEQADFSQYKVIYFFNQVVATDEERAAIEQLKGSGRTLIFCWSAGFLNGNDSGPNLVTELTGIRMGNEVLRGPARIRITDFDTPVTRELVTVRALGTDMVYSPLLRVDDTEASVFGVYDWNGASAAAFRRHPDWTSVTIGTSTAEVELLRGIFRQAGCTVRCETGDVLVENRSILGLHIRQAGPQLLRIPPDCSGLEDLYTGRRFMVTGGAVHIGHGKGKGETRLFRKIGENG